MPPCALPTSPPLPTDPSHADDAYPTCSASSLAYALAPAPPAASPPADGPADRPTTRPERVPAVTDDMVHGPADPTAARPEQTAYGRNTTTRLYGNPS